MLLTLTWRDLKGIPFFRSFSAMPCRVYTPISNHSKIWRSTSASYAMRRDGAFALATLNALVARRRKARPDPALGLLTHPMAGLLPKILYVVVCHENLDSVENFFRRPLLRSDDHVLLREVDLNSARACPA
jgi:hypothetical protein